MRFIHFELKTGSHWTSESENIFVCGMIFEMKIIRGKVIFKSDVNVAYLNDDYKL